MLWAAVVVCGGLWFLGVTTAHTMGGLIHILFLLAVAALILQALSRRRVA